MGEPKNTNLKGYVAGQRAERLRIAALAEEWAAQAVPEATVFRITLRVFRITLRGFARHLREQR